VNTPQCFRFCRWTGHRCLFPTRRFTFVKRLGENIRKVRYWRCLCGTAETEGRYAGRTREL